MRAAALIKKQNVGMTDEGKRWRISYL